MKILITGIDSRLGVRLREEFARRNLPVIGLALTPKEPSFLKADITEKSSLRPIFERERPDFVIHAAALTDVDLCEKEKELAWKVNVTGTEIIAKAAGKVSAKMVYISTDYVFDGKSGPYPEEAQPSPLNVYGQTKLEGEKAAQSLCKHALIIRTCVPYDWNPNATPNFLMWLVQELKENRKLKIVADQFNTPTFMPHFAECITELCLKNCTGIMHCSGKEFISRYEFSKKVCSLFGFPISLIEPCSTQELKQTAPRPLKAGLIVEKVEKILEKKMLTVEEGLRRTHQLYVTDSLSRDTTRSPA